MTEPSMRWGGQAMTARQQQKARDRWLRKLSLASGLDRAPQGSSLTWEEREHGEDLIVSCRVTVAGRLLAKLVHTENLGQRRGRRHLVRANAFEHFCQGLRWLKSQQARDLWRST